jgi:Fis family transcriptional regulator
MNKHAPSKNFLRSEVTKALQEYFSHIEDGSISNLYQLVLAEVEAPLLEMVMRLTKGNQSKAAQWLGLNRGTLRKLLSKYQLQ